MPVLSTFTPPPAHLWHSSGVGRVSSWLRGLTTKMWDSHLTCGTRAKNVLPKVGHSFSLVVRLSGVHMQFNHFIKLNSPSPPKQSQNFFTPLPKKKKNGRKIIKPPPFHYKFATVDAATLPFGRQMQFSSQICSNRLDFVSLASLRWSCCSGISHLRLINIPGQNSVSSWGEDIYLRAGHIQMQRMKAAAWWPVTVLWTNFPRVLCNLTLFLLPILKSNLLETFVPPQVIGSWGARW